MENLNSNSEQYIATVDIDGKKFDIYSISEGFEFYTIHHKGECINAANPFLIKPSVEEIRELAEELEII